MSSRYVAARDHSRPRSPITWRTVPGECAHACPAGNPCTCTAQPHAWHICHDPSCWCHSAQRYARQPGKEVK
mgnify:CR=1 FL=1